MWTVASRGKPACRSSEIWLGVRVAGNGADCQPCADTQSHKQSPKIVAIEAMWKFLSQGCFPEEVLNSHNQNKGLNSRRFEDLSNECEKSDGLSLRNDWTRYRRCSKRRWLTGAPPTFQTCEFAAAGRWLATPFKSGASVL